MPEIVHELAVRAPAEQVYQALTSREGLENWWTRDVDIEPVQGSTAAFGFGAPEHLLRMRIERLKAFKLVHWRCVEGPAEWANTEIRFLLKDQPEGTTVLFRHLKWKSLDGTLARESYRWAGFLRSLKFYLERDAGMPYPHDIE